MAGSATGMVSVIGINLLEAIVQFAETLESTALVEPGEVQAGPQENGYSCAIVTLNALVFESAINRTRYVRQETCDDDSVNYFAKVTSNAELAKDVDEVVAVRDAIVHNHLWKADIVWDDKLKLMFNTPPTLLDGFGNKRQRRIMNPKTRLSRRLGLNLFPLRIWRRDAYVSLRVVALTLEALEAKDASYFPISNQQFKFRGQMTTLKKVVDALPQF